MFRKRRTIINGVELPEEFSGASVVNDVAISGDGKRYAYVTPQGGIVTGDMPKDGRLNVGGTEIQYKKGISEGINFSGPGVRIVQSGYGSTVVSTGRGLSVSQMCVGGGGVSQISIGGSGLEYQIDKSYDSVRKVVLQQSSGGIELDLSDDGKTYVQGFTGAEPRYDNGRLVVDGLDGVLKLPKSSTELEVDISTTTGGVRGKVAHKGRIATVTGGIRIELHAPLEVRASAVTGGVSVRKMISEGGGLYTPPNGQPNGTLEVRCTTGGVNVDYAVR